MVASLQLRQQVRQRHLSQTRPSDCRVAPTPASRYMLTVWLMCRLSRTRLGVKAMFDLKLEACLHFEERPVKRTTPYVMNVREGIDYGRVSV